MFHSDPTERQSHNQEPHGSNPGDAVFLRQITKTYRRGQERVAVLQDFDLRIAHGEFVALMGPSGSGKTTILNLIGGLDRPQAGVAIVAGEHLEALSHAALSRWRARRIGFVFQFYNLMPMLSAAANVELPLLLTRLTRAERRAHVDAALALVGLGHRAAHKPGEMSGGQQQRVGIARAIVTDPSILLCDEPTGDLDRKSADEILTLLQMLNHEQSKTIVMVTHDRNAAEFASRELHLDKVALTGKTRT